MLDRGPVCAYAAGAPITMRLWCPNGGARSRKVRAPEGGTMRSDADARQELLELIRPRRAGISAFVRNLGSRGARLTNVSIVCSVIVTALTAGPALGGAQFTGATANALNLPDNSLVWRGLCFLAMVLSIVAAVATNLYKSHDVAARLARAEATNVALEGLETMVEFAQVSTADAVERYQQLIAEVPFISDAASPAPTAAASRRRSRGQPRSSSDDGGQPGVGPASPA